MILARLERHHDTSVGDRRFEGAHHLNGAGKRGYGLVKGARVVVVAVGEDVNIGVIHKRVFLLGIMAPRRRVVIADGVRVVESHEDSCELLAGGFAPGVEKVGPPRSHPGYETGARRPVKGILRVAVSGSRIGEQIGVPGAHGVVVLIDRIAVEHGGELLAGDLPVRVEHALADAVDDFVILRPDDRPRVVLPVLHVGENGLELHLRRLFHAVEDRDDHGTGHCPRGIEFSASHAVHVAVVVGVLYRLVAPPGLFHVGERGFFSCHGDRQRPGEHQRREDQGNELFHGMVPFLPGEDCFCN